MLRWTVRRGFGVGPALMTAVLALGLSHTSMLAQAQAQDAPYDGVAEDRSELRAGAGTSYYVVGELPKGAEVRVEEILFGWSKIAPPSGMYSYISKSFVDSTDGKTGKVNSDRAPVKAANPNGPGDSFRTQVTLKPGDNVTILGEDGNFYRISPPAGSFVYAPPGKIRRKTAGAAPVVAAPAAPTPAPAAATPKPAPAPAAATPAVKPAPAAATPAPAPAPAAATPKPAPAPAAVVTPAPAPAPAPAVATPAPAPAPAPAAVQTMTDTTGLVTPATADVIEPTKAHEATPTGTGTPVDTATGTPVPDAPKPATTRTTRTPRPAAPAAAEAPAPAPRPAPVAGVGGLPGAISPQVQAAEARYGQVLDQPLEKQPLNELIATYESLHSDPTIPPLDRRIVAARLAQLRRNQELAGALRSIGQTQTDLQSAPPIRIEPQSSRVLNNGPDARYTAVGQLLASSVFNGQNMPTLFRVVDPASGRTVAYVRPVSALSPLEWAAMLGKTVGVIGEYKNDPALKLRIIDVSKVDLLHASEPARQ